MPDVSVVIPTYNRENYLRRAVASCFDGNVGLDVEVVVVDDGSSDGTRKYLDDRVRPIFQEHQGSQVVQQRALATLGITGGVVADNWPRLRARLLCHLEDWIRANVIHAQFGPMDVLVAPVTEALGIPLLRRLRTAH